MFLIVFEILWYIFIFSYILAHLICAIRNRKCQKKWDKEKAMRVRIDPKITRAELCEQYVMFRIRNNCDVEF